MAGVMSAHARRTTVARASLAAGLLLLAAPGGAQTGTASVTISGSSTIRSWSCKAPGTVQFKPAGGAPVLPGMKTGVDAGTLTVKVVDLNCSNDEMTGHLRDAMQPDRNATITFELTKYAVAGSSADTTGNLTINGVTRPVSVPVKLQAAEGGGVRLEGDASITMTDYKVEPPTVLLGALTVRPLVRVHFEATIR
jgi:polyisoprenoid-binding protein YceI